MRVFGPLTNGGSNWVLTVRICVLLMVTVMAVLMVLLLPWAEVVVAVVLMLLGMAAVV